jgi:hypothetical protein
LAASLSRAEGQKIQWVRNGDIVETSPVAGSGASTVVVEAHAGDWFSVILRDERGPTLFSNPIFVER